MFDKILIANRGEIAVRIIKTARRMGIKTALVYSDADKASLAVQLADEAIHIGPAPARQSYLDMDKIIGAAKLVGANAIHPGFGFLSENAEFARRLRDENIVFIGPNPKAIAAMGDKIEAKRAAERAGVSCVPGFIGEIIGIDHAKEIAREIGYPVMIKASAGGGGKGIRIAQNDGDVEEGFPAVVAEAASAFGDDRVFIEKFIIAPRHIEIQLLGDKHGNVVHLFERECSIQRRNQKVVEEAPSPLLDEETRQQMGEQAKALAKAVGYDSAGTVEFVASGHDKSFYFLEMNTRLQVEHPVTEMITGLDLVEQMILVAAGEKLAFAQEDIAANGWAIETRLYAEDPYRGFLPSIGRLRRFRSPPEGADPITGTKFRLDTGVREGDEISIHYDPMIAKVVTWGKDRLTAIDAQGDVLDSLWIEGIADNSPFLAAVMAEPDFRSGDFTTAYIGQHFPKGFLGQTPNEDEQRLLAAVAALVHCRKLAREQGISGQMVPAKPMAKNWQVLIDRVAHPLEIEPSDAGAFVTFESGRQIRLESDMQPGQKNIHVKAFVADIDGTEHVSRHHFRFKDRPEGFVLSFRGITANLIVANQKLAALHALLPEKIAPDMSLSIHSPMPGLVMSVAVKAGDMVKAGQNVLVIEAMKMQNILKAERDGQIQKVHVTAGDSVAADDILVSLIDPDQVVDG